MEGKKGHKKTGEMGKGDMEGGEWKRQVEKKKKGRKEGLKEGRWSHGKMWEGGRYHGKGSWREAVVGGRI